MLTADPLAEEARDLLAHPSVGLALGKVDEWRDEVLREWRAFVETSAPSGQEDERREIVARWLARHGCEPVSVDRKGNVIGIRRGQTDEKAVVFDSHLDAIYKEKIAIQSRIADGRLYAPGAHDDAAQVVACLYALRALDEAGIRTRRPLWLVGTVEEEAGVAGGRVFVEDHHREIEAYVFCDGELGEVRHGRSSGIHWWEIHFHGPGGHPWHGREPLSATAAVARAVDRLYREVRVTDAPGLRHSSLNVGMLGAGDAPNMKATDAWFSLDIRSLDGQELERVESEALRIVAEVAAEFDVREERRSLLAIPPGVIERSEETRVVRAALAVLETLDVPASLDIGGVGMAWAIARGIPAITLGATTRGHIHSPDEWAGIEPIYTGIKQYILLALLLAGMA